MVAGLGSSCSPAASPAATTTSTSAAAITTITTMATITTIPRHDLSTTTFMNRTRTSRRDDDRAPCRRKRWDWWRLIVLGVSGGIVPCWDAIAMLGLAISAGQLWLGLPLLLAFSAGLAGVLVAIGVSVVYARNFADKRWGGPNGCDCWSGRCRWSARCSSR